MNKDSGLLPKDGAREREGVALPHQLLIEFGIEFESHFSPFLKDGEVVRGELFKLSVSATNLSSSRFPGAQVEELEIQYHPYGDRAAVVAPDTDVSCPEIDGGEKVTFLVDEFLAADEGTAWILIRMKAKDAQDIKCYQSPTSPSPVSNRWVNCFYVVSSEHVQLMMVLDQIVKHLRRKEKGHDSL